MNMLLAGIAITIIGFFGIILSICEYKKQQNKAKQN